MLSDISVFPLRKFPPACSVCCDCQRKTSKPIHSFLYSTIDSSTMSRRSYRNLDTVLWTTWYTSALACGSFIISFLSVGNSFLETKYFNTQLWKLVKIIARCFQMDMDTAFYTNRSEPFYKHHYEKVKSRSIYILCLSISRQPEHTTDATQHTLTDMRIVCSAFFLHTTYQFVNNSQTSRS